MNAAAVRREWLACREILLMPLHRRRSQGMSWVSWMLLCLAALGASAAFGSSPQKWKLFGTFTALPLGMLFMQWWVLLFGSMMEQCRAAPIRLVPHMRERAMRVMTGAWAVGVAMMTLLLGVPFGHPVEVAVATGLVVLEMTVLFSFGRIAAIWLIFVAASFTGLALRQSAAQFAASGAFPLVLVVLLALDGHVALRRMFGTAARPHAWPELKNQPLPCFDSLARFLQRLGGDHSAKLPPILKVFVMVPFGSSRLALILLLVLCAAVRMWIHAVQKVDAHDGMFWLRCLVMFSMLAIQVVAVGLAAVAGKYRHDDQALFCLTPAAPAAPDFNRQLARHLLAGQARMAAEHAALTLVALFALGASAGEVGRAAVVCLMSLALIGVPLRDYSRAGPGGGANAVTFWILFPAIGVATLAALSGAGDGTGWAVCALVGAGLSCWFVRARWTAMLAAPPAYPAQRRGLVLRT